jgi:GH35 family endo-1,4-beta-xylanase
MKKLASFANLVLFLSLILSACWSGKMFEPTITPTFTFTPMLTPTPTISPTPTITVTPAPENLVGAADLPVWIDDYVNAYSGTVIVNGAENDANQLLGAVKADPASFIEKKTIKGSETLFFVVDGIPLAIQNGLLWRPILARDISDAMNAQFAMPVLSFQLNNPNLVNAIKNANMLTITWDFDTGQVLGKLTTNDWRNILDNWDTIKAQLDSGQIPNGISYDWTGADQIIQFAHENQMGLRAHGLVLNGDVPDAIYNSGFTKAELLKVIEFFVSVKLIKYKGVVFEWDASDELVISEFSTDKYGFWQQHVGILDATRMAASTIRKIDPQAKITFTDDHETEGRFYDEQPNLGVRFMKYVKILKREGLIDKVDIENNLWIYDLPDQEYMEKFLRQLQAEGIELAAAEINVFPTKQFPFWYKPRQAYTIVDDPLKAQAEGYRRIVQAYFNAGAYDIGLGDVGDEISSTNYLAPGSNTTLFDNQWKPKMGYYEILKVMYADFITKG